MLWYTSTLLSLKGGPDFFYRDSGLICKKLQSMGFPCKSIMPLPSYPDDINEDLIRTDFANLANPVWWNSIGAHKVVLYSWGHPKYYRVAEAVHKSGAKVFVNLDNAGILFPSVTPTLYSRAVLAKQMRIYGPIFGTIIGLLYNFAYHIYIPILHEPARIAHLRSATAIGCISEISLSLWRLWARKYAPDLVERMHLVPNPVADYVKYDTSIEKQDSVIAVGRWDYVECKRPALLAKVINIVAKLRSKTSFHIYGNPGYILTAWHGNLPADIQKRVHLHKKVNHLALAKAYIQSRVGLCTSSHEGSHVASEEALCAGATVVAPLRTELNAMLWYVSNNSGRLSIEDSAKGLAEALLLELEAWDRGERDPLSISNYWRSILSATAVVHKIRQLLD